MTSLPWARAAPTTLHLLIESMRLAYADRSRYLGDPDHVDVPVAGLTDKAYAARLRAGIDAGRARPSAEVAPGIRLAPEGSDTTHFTVADRFGNVVSNTYTLNFSFGSHIAVPGTGMLLNNEMADFAAQPGTPNAFGLVESDANAIAGGKRPLSSMSPTLVLRDGRPWLATGSPGGSVIITTVLQTLLNAMVFDMNVAAASAAPRLHHQWLPDRVRAETGFSPDTLRLLEARGTRWRSGSAPWAEHSRSCSRMDGCTGRRTRAGPVAGWQPIDGVEPPAVGARRFHYRCGPAIT
jgi:gamma-glutamyltranspeptidase/glutathione hydrolase